MVLGWVIFLYFEDIKVDGRVRCEEEIFKQVLKLFLNKVGK